MCLALQQSLPVAKALIASVVLCSSWALVSPPGQPDPADSRPCDVVFASSGSANLVSAADIESEQNLESRQNTCPSDALGSAPPIVAGEGIPAPHAPDATPGKHPLPFHALPTARAPPSDR